MPYIGMKCKVSQWQINGRLQPEHRIVLPHVLECEQSIWIGNVTKVESFKLKNEKPKLTQKFIENYDHDSNKGYILKVDVSYPKRLQEIYMDLSFLPERMKIDKYQKLVFNIHDKKSYVVHIIALKQALNDGLTTEKVQSRRMIEVVHIHKYTIKEKGQK